MKRLLLLGTLWALMGMSCLSIEQMHVQTIAVNCDVARGSTTQAQGAGGGALAERAADAAGALRQAMTSEVDCPDDGPADSAAPDAPPEVLQ